MINNFNILNNIEINDEFYKSILKKFIFDNKLNQTQIIDLINNLKKLKKNIYINSDNLSKTNDIESFDNLNSSESDIVFITESENNKQNKLFNSLVNNDINSWIFMGIILISIVLVLMIIIYKK